MDKQQLLELIDEKVDEIFLAYQNANGITDGGIEPFDALHLDQLKEKLAEHVIQVCAKQPKEIPSSYLYIDGEGIIMSVFYPHIDTDKFFTEISRRIAFSDCSNEEVLNIVWQGKEVKYVGWRPGMVFEYKDLEGNVVWSASFQNWDH